MENVKLVIKIEYSINKPVSILAMSISSVVLSDIHNTDYTPTLHLLVYIIPRNKKFFFIIRLVRSELDSPDKSGYPVRH